MMTFSSVNSRSYGRRPSLLLLAIALVWLPGWQKAQAHLIYRTDSNAFSPPVLHEYDTAANTWATRAALPAANTTQLASDGASVFALPENGNIYRYNRASDSWSFVQAGPAASVGRNNISMFETYNGEFYWADDGTNQLFYTVGGVWNSITTPRPVSSGSDIDRQNGRVYIRTMNELGGFVYDVASNSFPTIFNDATSVGENSRVGGFHNGFFYSRTIGGNLIRIEPTTNTPVDTGVPLATTHASMAISPDGLVYLNGYSNTETDFEVFNINTNTVTALANAPFVGSNSHSSLAWVAVPEPATMVFGLFGAGLLGTVVRRRHR